MLYVAGLVVFVIELVVWGAVASLGLAWLGTGWLGWTIAVLIFLAVVGFWSVFMAPKAPRRFGLVPYYIARAVIYLVAAYAIFRASHLWALVFVIAVAITEPLFYRHNIGQDESSR